MSNYKAFYQYRHEINEPEVFGYICRKNEVYGIEQHIAELYGTIIDPCPVDKNGAHIPVEQLTSDPVLQGWESFDGLILEDVDTGERFNYVEVQGGFGLEPLGGKQ
jgi:hypothetical protein